MTAAERLRHLAGIGGTAAVLLLAIGTGATTGAALADYSGLASGTAAEHLLAEREQKQESAGGGASPVVVTSATRLVTRPAVAAPSPTQNGNVANPATIVASAATPIGAGATAQPLPIAEQAAPTAPPSSSSINFVAPRNEQTAPEDAAPDRSDTERTLADAGTVADTPALLLRKCNDEALALILAIASAS